MTTVQSQPLLEGEREVSYCALQYVGPPMCVCVCEVCVQHINEAVIKSHSSSCHLIRLNPPDHHHHVTSPQSVWLYVCRGERGRDKHVIYTDTLWSHWVRDGKCFLSVSIKRSVKKSPVRGKRWKYRWRHKPNSSSSSSQFNSSRNQYFWLWCIQGGACDVISACLVGVRVRFKCLGVSW